jgi:hypothetical protein
MFSSNQIAWPSLKRINLSESLNWNRFPFEWLTLRQWLSFYCRQPWRARKRGSHFCCYRFPPRGILHALDTARRGMFHQFRSMLVFDLCRLWGFVRTTLMSSKLQIPENESRQLLVTRKALQFLTSLLHVLIISSVGSCCSTRMKNVVNEHPCSSVVYRRTGWYIVILKGSQDQRVKS